MLLWRHSLLTFRIKSNHKKTRIEHNLLNGINGFRTSFSPDWWKLFPFSCKRYGLGFGLEDKKITDQHRTDELFSLNKTISYVFQEQPHWKGSRSLKLKTIRFGCFGIILARPVRQLNFPAWALQKRLKGRKIWSVLMSCSLSVRFLAGEQSWE